MGEREQVPKIPPSDEVLAHWAANDGAMDPVNFESHDQRGIYGFMRALAKRGLDKAAKKVMEKVVGEGPEYLKTHQTEYADTVAHIREIVRGVGGADFGDEADFESRLQAYTANLRQHPNGEDFEQRMPAIAFEQARGIRSKGRLVLRITRQQAEMMRTYREFHERTRVKNEFETIIDQLGEPEGEVA